MHTQAEAAAIAALCVMQVITAEWLSSESIACTTYAIPVGEVMLRLRSVDGNAGDQE